MSRPTNDEQERSSSTLRATDVALLFGVTVTTIRKWARAGKLPSFRTPGQHLRFHLEDVDKLVTDSVQEPLQEAK